MPRRVDLEAEMARHAEAGGAPADFDPQSRYAILLGNAIDDLIDRTTAQGKTLAFLTGALIGLTVVILLLTVVIGYFTAALASRGG